MKKQRIQVTFLAILLCLCMLLSGCGPSDVTPEETTTQAPPTVSTLNGTALAEYTIVYSADEPDYNQRAADYIAQMVLARAGITLAVKTDAEAKAAHEIVVGETNRPISTQLEAETKDDEFALLANDGSVAMEGDYFLIAAAAYYFIETYVPAAGVVAAVPTTAAVCKPITKAAKNYILMIGDGMGFSQTYLPQVMTAPESGRGAYSDGESIFYGYYFPYSGESRTDSLSGTTDSAAGGTALATGYKTSNGRVGMTADQQVLTSLTELAGQKGMATAVMSTEAFTGATPATFLAHAPDRDDTRTISAGVTNMFKTYGTVVRGPHDQYEASGILSLEAEITKILDTVSQDEDGFFMMYEEAYIDKHCHKENATDAYYAVLRFNQVIARFAEYACYHPDTMLIITADHETGGMYDNGSGGYQFTNGEHSSQNVPVFAWGAGAECFDGKTVENVQIGKTIASFMGERNFGMEGYSALN